MRAAPVCPALPLMFLRSRPWWLGGQVDAVSGGPEVEVNSAFQASCQGQSLGRCRTRRRAERANREWWIDVTLPILELARRRIRGLVRFIEKTRRAVVYTNFEDELADGTIIDLPGINVGTNWERFRAKARAYLRDHGNHVALQRLRRNKQLTPDDLGSLERMRIESGAGDESNIAQTKEESQGLGLERPAVPGLRTH